MSFYAEVKFAPCSQTRDRIVWDGQQTLYKNKLYRESFSPDAFLPRDPDNPPTFQLLHDGEIVGRVVAMAAHKDWWYADIKFDDGPLEEVAREFVVPGASVSLDARIIACDEDAELRLVRHTAVKLNHIALLGKGDIPGYTDAKVTRVWEAKPKPKPRETVATTSLRAAQLREPGVLIRDCGEILAVR